ncbi:MFS transporter [Subtercola boreus]|uniref:MFS transporter n=1 Tax=Subtercola boreus TaxID=120213 RepID=UPI001558DEA6|nr:MFS transporter [Subtercola boreus]
MSLQQFLDHAPLSRRQRIIFFLTFLVLVADGMDVAIVGLVFPRLIAEWGVTIGQVTLTVTVGILAMAVGAIVSGPIADRWGRKPVLIAGFLIFTLGTAALGLSSSIDVFIVVRILSCLGLGAVTPVAMTIVADWAPAARRAQMVALTFSGVALGTIVGAYLAATLIPSFGWQTMVIVAGLLPVLVVPFYLRLVAEPPVTLLKRGRPEPEVRRSLAVVGGDSSDVDLSRAAADPRLEKTPFATVLSRTLVLTTGLIWLLAFITQGLIIVVLQYMPILLQRPQPGGPGLDTAQSGLIMAMWGWGSLAGQISVSFVLKRLDRFLTGVIAAVWTIAGLAVVVTCNLGFAGLMVVLLVTAIGAASLPTITNAIGTIAYPDRARATGVGASSFMGRIGSVASGLAGGLLIAAGFTLPALFAALTVPVLVVGGAFIGLRAETRRRTRASAAAAESVSPVVATVDALRPERFS